MLGTKITEVDYKTTQLYGGTLGDVKLIEGNAKNDDGKFNSYKVVIKTQGKWERYKDADSWRREYDLYKSDLGKLFSESFRWAECYYTEINDDENETQIWMEYIDGVSGLDLEIDMYIKAAEELGRFQGKLYIQSPVILNNLTNLSKMSYAKDFYHHYRSWHEVYDYIRSDSCDLPNHLCKMLIEIDENEDEIFKRIEKLPRVFCHRDFWVTNIFYVNGNIRLIDWDTTGWGYLGEDIAALIADEANVELMLEIYQKCIPAYYKGFSQYVDISGIKDNCIWELIIVLFGYRLIEWYKIAESHEEKEYHLKTMQKIYEMKKESYENS